MGRKTKDSMLTLIISIVNSIISVLFSLIYNNYLIRIYGSQTNGLISTLTQFVSLFTVIEGGFTTAAIVATYSPIVNNDYQRLNDILYTTKRIYLKLGGIITGAVLLAGSIYIGFVDSPFSYMETYLLLVISALSTAASLCFLSKYSVVLQGNNKEYVQVVIALFVRTITWILSMILMLLHFSILIVYTTNLVNILINVWVLRIYERKKYSYITYKGKYDKGLIKGTRDVLFQKIAGTIFTSTDLILISVCISLSHASVYNLYYQIFKAVFALLSSVAQAPFNSFGHLYKEESNRKKFKEYFDIYQHLVLIVSTTLLLITGELILPFVKMYTAKFHDINYVQPMLVILFFSQIFAQIVNRPYGTILNATGNFKMQNIQCALAAAVNIAVSLFFIKWWGINSIVFGSFIGTLIILVMNVQQAYKHVLKKSCFKAAVNIVVNYVVAVVIIMFFLHIGVAARGYIGLISIAILYFIASAIVIFSVNFILDKSMTKKVLNYVMEKLVKRFI